MKARDCESDGLELDTAPQDRKEEFANTSGSVTTLKELTLQLLREVQCIGEIQPTNLEGGLDFYEEVVRFEIDLIKRALFLTAGHQGRAARLLNLNATTLNSKIKHYGIHLDGFAGTYPLLETVNNTARQHA